MASEESRERFARKNEAQVLQAAFGRLDKNRDGKIDAEELAAFLSEMGHKIKRSEVEDMIWEVDEDCDGCVCMSEFAAMWSRCREDRAGTEPRQLFNVVQFVVHDPRGSGAVSLEEAMRITYLRVGKEALDEQLEAVFGSSDISSGRTLSLTEFLHSLNASQLQQLKSRPTFALKQAAGAQPAAAVAAGDRVGAKQ